MSSDKSLRKMSFLGHCCLFAFFFRSTQHALIRHASNLTFLGVGVTCSTAYKWFNLIARGGNVWKKIEEVKMFQKALRPTACERGETTNHAASCSTSKLGTDTMVMVPGACSRMLYTTGAMAS